MSDDYRPETPEEEAARLAEAERLRLLADHPMAGCPLGAAFGVWEYLLAHLLVPVLAAIAVLWGGEAIARWLRRGGGR